MNRPLSHEQFERIVKETHLQLRAQIAGMGVPADAVDDVAQEVYLDLARQSERVPEGLEIGRWLRGMARNCSYEYFRRNARQPQRLTEIANLLGEESDQAEPLDESRALTDLRLCIEQLHPSHRRLINDYYLAERSVNELADEHGRSVGAVHMVLSRLREVLRRCMHQRLGLSS